MKCFQCHWPQIWSLQLYEVFYRKNVSVKSLAVVSYWRKYVHLVLVNRLGGLSLSRNSLVRLTDRSFFFVDIRQQTCLNFSSSSH